MACQEFYLIQKYKIAKILSIYSVEGENEEGFIEQIVKRHAIKLTLFAFCAKIVKVIRIGIAIAEQSSHATYKKENDNLCRLSFGRGESES